MEPMMGFEPMTSSLPRKRSTPELHRHLSGRRDSNPRPLAWKANALSAELLPLLIRGYKGNELKIKKLRIPEIISIFFWFLWEEQDSNLRRRKSAELQSAPVGHFGIFPYHLFVKRLLYCIQ